MANRHADRGAVVQHKGGSANSTRVVLGLGILLYAWRFQELFPLANAFRPVMLLTGLFLLILLIDPRLVDEMAAVAARPPAVFAMILVALALAGVPLSLIPGVSLQTATKELAPAVVLMVGIAATTKRPAHTYQMAAVQIAGALVFSWFVLTRFSIGTSGRLGDLVYYDANDLGLVLICTLPMVEWFATQSRSIVARVAASATGGILLLTIVKTGSRGAFLGLIAIVAYGIMFKRSVPIRRRLTVGIVVAVVLAGAGTSQYWGMMNTIVHPTKDYNWAGNSQTGRMDIWKRGIGYMLDNPITGIGANAFSRAEGTISPLAARQAYGVGLKWSAAHNSFVQVGAEMGFPGLAAYLALLFAGLATARQAVRLGLSLGDERAAAMGDALAASIVGFMVSGFFLSEAYHSYIYLVIGMDAGLHRSLVRRITPSHAPKPVSATMALARSGGTSPIGTVDR